MSLNTTRELFLLVLYSEEIDHASTRSLLLSAFSLLHPCQRGVGNLRWHGWSSKKNQIRMLYCRTCKTYFSERKGSALWHSRLPEEKAGSVLEHIADGCGVRQTARLVKVHRDTVCRLNRQAGDHAARTHDEVVSVTPPHRRDPV